MTVNYALHEEPVYQMLTGKTLHTWGISVDGKYRHTYPDLVKGNYLGKGSSLVIVPLTILDSGTFTTSEVAADWHWL